MTVTAMPTRPGTYMRRAPGWEQHGWTPGPNALIRDITVDWDARSAYMWIASHQETFELDAEKLAAAGPRGRNHAYEMLRTLEFHGWLTRTRYRATDGRGTVHIWNLHPLRVPHEERSWKPSKAEMRAGYTAPDGTVMPPLNIDTLAVEAPELPDGRKFRKSDIAGDEPAGQPGLPGRSEVPAEELPGNLYRPGTDRPGFPYMEEKTKVEEQQETPQPPALRGATRLPARKCQRRRRCAGTAGDHAEHAGRLHEHNRPSSAPPDRPPRRLRLLRCARAGVATASATCGSRDSRCRLGRGVTTRRIRSWCAVGSSRRRKSRNASGRAER